MWEDAANSVGGGGVSMPSGVSAKKKKKNIYDGRTKAGRKFVEKILSRRKAAEARKEVKEVSIAEALSKYDFRYWRGTELELKNRANGRDVEAAFKKAGYDVSGRGGDVNVMGTTVKFNNQSKHWGTDDKKLKAAIKKVLGIDVDKL